MKQQSKRLRPRGSQAVLALAFVHLVGCAHGSFATPPAGPVEVPAVARPSSAIELRTRGLYPETVVYDPSQDRFLVGSVRRGGVYAVGPSGEVEPFVEDERLCSVLGLAVDLERRRLFVTNADLGVSLRPSAAGPRRLAALGVYDLDTGQPIHYVNLDGLLPDVPHLPNGVAVDASGNAYVTDSFAPVIYQVRPSGEANVWLSDPRLTGEGIQLNGVVAHPGGFLLVVTKGEGALYRVPLHAPERIAAVTVEGPIFGADGVTLDDRGRLLVIANEAPARASNAAYLLTSDDQWSSARRLAEIPLGAVYPTTATFRDGQLYVMHTQLDELLHGRVSSAEQEERVAILTPHALPTPSAGPGAFVYSQLQLVDPAQRPPWTRLHAGLESQPGFLSATLLAGTDAPAFAALYAFETVDQAREFVTEFYPARARELGVAQSTRLFDAAATAEASSEMDSPYFGGSIEHPSAFVYTEVQTSIPFTEVPWGERNTAIRQSPGFLAKTWLSGAETHTVGGLYVFDSVLHARTFALETFPESARRQGRAFTVQVFDAATGEQASRELGSPFYR